MASLLVVVTLAQALVLTLGVLTAELVEGWTHVPLGEAHAQALGAAVGLAFLCVTAALGIAHDLASAAVVRRRVGGLRALAAGTRALWCAPASLGWSWAWRTTAALALVAAGGRVADRLGGRAGVSLLFLALAHQAVILSRVSLRASWLAAALRRLPASSQP